MSKPALKKELQNLDRNELIDLVLELYSRRKEAREYLEFWLDPDAETEFKKVRELVTRVFSTSKGVWRANPRISDLNSIIRNFMSLCVDPQFNAELLIWVCQIRCAWIYGKQKYTKTAVAAARKSYEDACRYADEWGEDQSFHMRLDKIGEDIREMDEMCNRRMSGTYRRRRRY